MRSLITRTSYLSLTLFNITKGHWPLTYECLVTLRVHSNGGSINFSGWLVLFVEKIKDPNIYCCPEDDR
jgi:hypothetical protein